MDRMIRWAFKIVCTNASCLVCFSTFPSFGGSTYWFQGRKGATKWRALRKQAQWRNPRLSARKVATQHWMIFSRAPQIKGAILNNILSLDVVHPSRRLAINPMIDNVRGLRQGCLSQTFSLRLLQPTRSSRKVNSRGHKETCMLSTLGI